MIGESIAANHGFTFSEKDSDEMPEAAHTNFQITLPR